MAFQPWRTNAQLIEECVRLGYLRPELSTLDPTYGSGRWWKNWHPANLTACDLRCPAKHWPAWVDFVCRDFTQLPWVKGLFDRAVFDPPYVSIGGRKPSGMTGMHDSYGQMDAARTPEDLQLLINTGLTEVLRVVKPRGFVLVKCQDYVSGGHLWSGVYETQAHARSLGAELHDRLEHWTYTPRPQPPGRPQRHARGNLSVLLVLRKGKT